MNKLFILASLFFLLASCKQNNATQESVDIQYRGDTLVVKEGSSILEQIITGKSQSQDFSAEFRTVGTIRPVAGKYAEIAPPFSGRITKTFVELGKKVSAGSPVFELSSSEFYEAVKAYFAAQSANELAQKNYNRQKELEANGVASQKELEQAQNEANITAKEWEQAKVTLQIFNIEAGSLQMGQALKVVSPIAGEVVKYDITIGSYIREDAEPLAVVADLTTVWVTALVKEKNFGTIKKGERVKVFTDAHPDKTIWGTIYHIGEMLDEETRSLQVIIACDNADRELKPGMFCKVHFLSSPTKAIVLPATAVMQEQENDYVLIEASKGRYLRRKVETETVSMDEVRIISGISEGENVVIKGGIFLNM
ncbi:efflux RND transporter periplasmic adaptor subunit [uncultured Proteiniphilum sp.]|uniref:efflux RND transporter periplasmic adaptor subunit n=1 Tax=uncultured Proteiniphilum sp. TaxID=497637 RepID=UPI002632C246|nr:efflux RND transporter periplasmic adaptor subunit [uncultured Proteiniphilum sp.]